jgi:hypothetical protein
MTWSKADDSAWERLLPAGIEESDTKDEHILVKLSAAGMDFFEPERKIQKPVTAEEKKARVRVPLGH